MRKILLTRFYASTITKTLLIFVVILTLACTEVKKITRIKRVKAPQSAELPSAKSQSGKLNPITFQKLLNQYRKRNGLTAIRYNPNYNWIAARNNVAQRQNRACGHFFTKQIAQNAASGKANPQELLKLWASSSEHNKLLLDSSVTEFGIHSDGHYSTIVMPSRYLGFPINYP